MLLNCLGEYFWESFGLQRDQILKEINQEYSLAGLLLKLMLQYFGHLKGRTDSLENTLMLEKIDGRRREDRGWDGWMASPTQWTWVWANSRRWWKTGRTGMLQSKGSKRVGHDWATEQQWVEGRGMGQNRARRFRDTMTMCKKYKQQGSIFQHRETLLLVCNNFKLSIIYKNIESLCCTSKNNIIL